MDKTSNETDNIQKIFKQIEDLKNTINEKDELIKKLNEIVLNQEKRINNNENEIKELKEKNEKLFIENKNNIDKINSKLSNQEKEVAKLIKINKKNPCRSNEEIDEINKKNIDRYITNFSNKEKVKKELHELRELEKNYGFLNCIGVKLLLKHNFNEIEGFIRAPDNSSYKNGIFNFIVKLPENCQNKPEVKFKTKIFHTEVPEDNSKCCIYWDCLNIPFEKISLSLILISIYEFFLGNNNHGYSCLATELYRKFYRTENYGLFFQKCEEYTRKYASNKFDSKLIYLFQDYYDYGTEFDGSRYIFYNFIYNNAKVLELSGYVRIVEIIENFLNISPGKRVVLLSGNNIYYLGEHLGDSMELLDSHIIFIAPNVNHN